jgi:hypothetical protein
MLLRWLSALVSPTAAEFRAVREGADARRGCSASVAWIASRWCQFMPSEEHNAVTLPNGMGRGLGGAPTILGGYWVESGIQQAAWAATVAPAPRVWR